MRTGCPRQHLALFCACKRYPSARPLAWSPSADGQDHRPPMPSDAAPAPSAKQLRWARARQETVLWARRRARANPVAARLRSTSRDSSRATRLPAFLRRLLILRLQDTEPESLEIMLRLLIVALPLVVALPAAFDEQEANAIQFEVQSPLQFEVRSPPESRPHRPAATRDQHNSPATHSTPHAQHQDTHITMHAPRH